MRGYRLAARAARLLRHLSNLSANHTQDISATFLFGQPIRYTVEFAFYLMDLFAVGEIYETIGEWFKYRTRALNAEERSIVMILFDDTIDVDRIRIDERAWAPRWAGMAYVGVYTINYYGPMSEDLFVHELIHIWQYETQGSVYIPRALWAQASSEGYNYGGVDRLRQAPINMLDYNYEQQGDILADYWRAKHKRPTRWKNHTGTTEPYQGLVAVLKKKERK